MVKKNILIIFTIFLAPVLSVFAATYVPLEPDAFPGVTNTSDLGVFLGQIFKWGISIAVALSLVMVIWGGIEYMTTDSWSGKDDGKTRIWNAFWGLGLALVSWLLLYTINPCLVQFSSSAGANDCKSANTFINPPPPPPKAT